MTSWQEAAGWSSRSPVSAEEALPIAQVMGGFGLSGQVKARLYNPSSPLFPGRHRVFLRQGALWWEVDAEFRPGPGGRWIASFVGCRSPEQAKALLDAELYLPRACLPALPTGEYYLADVIGSPVWVGEEVRGVLLDVHQAGPVDLLEVRDVAGEVHFVPCRSEFVASMSRGKVQLHPCALLDSES